MQSPFAKVRDSSLLTDKFLSKLLIKSIKCTKGNLDVIWNGNICETGASGKGAALYIGCTVGNGDAGQRSTTAECLAINIGDAMWNCDAGQ